MKYLVITQKFCPTLKSDQKSFLKWYVDAASKVCLYFKFLTGKTLLMGKVAIMYVS